MWYALAVEQDNVKEVIDYAQQQLASQPNEAGLRLLVARMYSLEGDLDKTLSLLNDIQADETTPIAYWNLKGQALVATNKVADATAFLTAGCHFTRKIKMQYWVSS